VWDFLIKLSDSKDGMSVILFVGIILSVLALIILGAFLLMIFKFLRSKPKVKANLNIAGQQLELGSSDNVTGTVSTPDPDNNRFVFGSLIPLMTSVVQISVEQGYKGAEKRQEVFDCQIHYARERFEMLRTTILSAYVAQNDTSLGIQSILRLTLKHVFEQKILLRLEKIFRADRLAEKTKDKIVEDNRSFVEGGFDQVKQEIGNLIQIQLIPGSDVLSQVFSSTKFLQHLETYREQVKRDIINCLEYAFSQAVSYLKDLQDVQSKCSERINNAIESYFKDLSIHESLPTQWDSSLPPNTIIGS